MADIVTRYRDEVCELARTQKSFQELQRAKKRSAERAVATFEVPENALLEAVGVLSEYTRRVHKIETDN